MVDSMAWSAGFQQPNSRFIEHVQKQDQVQGDYEYLLDWEWFQGMVPGNGSREWFQGMVPGNGRGGSERGIGRRRGVRDVIYIFVM